MDTAKSTHCSPYQTIVFQLIGIFAYSIPNTPVAPQKIYASSI